MSDEFLRENNGVVHDGASLASLIRAGYSSREALIASAFIEDNKKWERRYELLTERFNLKSQYLRQAYDNVISESGLKRFFFKKIAGLQSPAENKVAEVTKEVNDLASLITEHMKAQPDPLRYELAAQGNNIFKPR